MKSSRKSYQSQRCRAGGGFLIGQAHGGGGEWLQFLILEATWSRRNVIDIIRILIIAMEITLPIRQSCLCAAYAN